MPRATLRRRADSAAINALRPAVVVALFLRRREMQHGRRQAREPSEARTVIEIADDRRRARRAQFGDALGDGS